MSAVARRLTPYRRGFEQGRWDAMKGDRFYGFGLEGRERDGYFAGWEAAGRALP